MDDTRAISPSLRPATSADAEACVALWVAACAARDGQAFPGVGEDGTLTLTLGSHDFFWLRIRSAASNPASPFTQAMPVLSIDG